MVKKLIIVLVLAGLFILGYRQGVRAYQQRIAPLTVMGDAYTNSVKIGEIVDYVNNNDLQEQITELQNETERWRQKFDK